MYGVEFHAAVRLAVVDEGLSHREASRRFGVGRRTIRKMLSHSAPPGYRRTKSVRCPKLDGFTRIIRPAPSPRGTAPPRRTAPTALTRWPFDNAISIRPSEDSAGAKSGSATTSTGRKDGASSAPAPGRLAGIAAPPEDQVGVDVVAVSHLGHRNVRRVSLRNDPALLISRPETTRPTRHRKAASHSVH